MKIDLTGAQWVKSSYSGNGGNCIEFDPDSIPATVRTRDSKDPDGPVLAFPAGAWSAFVAGVKAGDFGTV